MRVPDSPRNPIAILHQWSYFAVDIFFFRYSEHEESMCEELNLDVLKNSTISGEYEDGS